MGSDRREPSLTASVAGVNSCQAAFIKPRNLMFNHGGVPPQGETHELCAYRFRGRRKRRSD